MIRVYPSPEELAEEAIAPEIVRQVGQDLTDDLGDGESICLMGKLPTINLVELAAVILKYIQEKAHDR